MRFIWDGQKDKINLFKHGIDFETASQVFNDINRFVLFDEAHSLYEDRYITVGTIENITVLAMVVYTEHAETIRIISARRATKEERGWYYGHLRGY